MGDGVSQVEVLLRLLDQPDGLTRQDTVRPPSKRKNKGYGPLNKTRIFLGGVIDGAFGVFGKPDPANSLRPASSSVRFAFDCLLLPFALFVAPID